LFPWFFWLFRETFSLLSNFPNFCQRVRNKLLTPSSLKAFAFMMEFFLLPNLVISKSIINFHKIIETLIQNPHKSDQSNKIMVIPGVDKNSS
jgi:hypothetical protein